MTRPRGLLVPASRRRGELGRVDEIRPVLFVQRRSAVRVLDSLEGPGLCGSRRGCGWLRSCLTPEQPLRCVVSDEPCGRRMELGSEALAAGCEAGSGDRAPAARIFPALAFTFLEILLSRKSLSQLRGAAGQFALASNDEASLTALGKSLLGRELQIELEHRACPTPEGCRSSGSGRPSLERMPRRPDSAGRTGRSTDSRSRCTS